MTDTNPRASRPFQRRGRDGRPDDIPGRRLFIAVPVADNISVLAESVVARVREAEGESGGTAAVPARAPHGVRWVRLDDLHLTVRFLGPTPEERLPDLERVVDRAAGAVPPFSLGIGGAGAFPHLVRPRALWLGVRDPSGSMTALAQATNDELVAVGFTRDDRPFNPHLTLARTDGVRSAARVGRRLVEIASHEDVVWFDVDRLVLFESHTGGGPARYVPLHEARLRG